MGECLKRVEGRKFVEASQNDAENAKAVTEIRGGLMSKALCRIIDEARTCTFEQLESLVANLHPDNKKLLRAITLETRLALWNPKKQREFRFWD